MNDLFNMDIKKISDVQNKVEINLYAKLENINIQKAVNNTEFLNATLTDETGYIYAKKWNITEKEKSLFKVGQLIFLSGVGNEYNNKTQLIINDMRPINESDDVDINSFYQSAPISSESLQKKLYSYIELIKNPILKQITEKLFKKYENEFLLYPAATKNHHAYISGLGHHVVSMLDLANAISGIYHNLNLDLLYSGIILHDIGKVIELSDHLAPQYTKMGSLIGHINICFQEIKICANELNFDGEEVMLLQHLILSHHGLLEYGSPKQPMVLEAEVLHLIDLLDSRINMIDFELKETDITEFTKRMYALDGRAFYKHNLK